MVYLYLYLYLYVTALPDISGYGTVPNQNYVMKTLPCIAALALAAMTARSADSLKSKALAAVKQFFPAAAGQRLAFKGRFVDTAADYGQTCQIVVDLSQPGREYLAVSGEYTPATKTGDGVFFAGAAGSFTGAARDGDTLKVEQTIEDSFSTWTRTTLTLSRSAYRLDVTLRQTSSFLLFTDTVEKHCRAPLDASARPEQPAPRRPR